MDKSNTHELFEKLNSFIKKYYFNQLIKGGIYVFSILIIFFLFFAIIEYFSSSPSSSNQGMSSKIA